MNNTILVGVTDAPVSRRALEWAVQRAVDRHMSLELIAVVGGAVGAVGEITSGPQAEEILAAGAADVILAGREWLRDPHFALRAATELGDPAAAPWPPQYVRARPRAAH